jgi:GntR family transcriptional regulator
MPSPPPLDRASPVPLFVQVRQWLLAEIRDWPDPSDRFHTEAELVGRLGVSRVTIRKALASVAAEGLLRRTPGAGSFVQPVRVAEALTPRMDVRGSWRDAGHDMEVRLLRHEVVPADGETARLLALVPGTPVLAIRRLRSTGGVGVAADDRVLPADLAADAGLDRPAAEGSIVERLVRGGIAVEAEWGIEAASDDPDFGALVGAGPGTPLLVRRMRYFGRDGRCVLAGRSALRGDLGMLRVRLPLEAGEDGGPPPRAPAWAETRR